MSKLLKNIGFFVVLVAIFSLGMIFYQKEIKSNLKPRKMIGATIRPFALSTESVTADPYLSIDQEMKFLVKLGANAARFNDEPADGVTSYAVDSAIKNKLTPILILEPMDAPIDFNNKDLDFYSLGYNYALKKAKEYKGRVKYYQLANEVSGTTASKADDSGEQLSNRFNLKYNKNRYLNVRNYLIGLSSGVTQVDPTAKKIITGHWVLVDVIKYLIKDGVNFEIVGWDWYSDMGDNVHERLTDEGYKLDLAATIKSWGKELWLVEVNREGGSFGGKAAEQAEYIQRFATTVLPDDDVKGFLIFSLTDSLTNPDDPVSSLGLIKGDRDSLGFSEYKPAFSALQKVISQYKSGKLGK